MKEFSEKSVFFGEFELSCAKRKLLRGGETVALNSKAFDLLLFLVENRGEILTKEQLLDKVWEGNMVEENNLTVQIAALRKVFGEKKDEHRFIATIPRTGYKFVAEVRRDTNNSKVEINGEANEIQSPNFFDERDPIIGREREIAEIKALLREKNKCFVTLTGAGGSGKTKLAETIADEMHNDFPDGVFFVKLAAVRQTELVLPAIAQTLGVKESSDKNPLETVKEFLREGNALLILDNFEQIVSAAFLIKEIFETAANLKILVTSRIALNLRFEHEKIIAPLPFPPANSIFSAREFAAFPSVELFVSRAKKVRASFVLNDENAATVATICRKLDGLPLAVELAAVRVKLLSPQAISVRLENSLNLLTGGAKDLSARQRTMRGAIEWSYELLEENEKILFRYLAVFAGGFTVEAVESVVEKTRRRIEVLDTLDSLVSNNLLVSDELPNGEVRLKMLEVIREFAFEMLNEEKESETLRRVHAEIFLALAEESDPVLQIGESFDLLEKLEFETGNFRTALAWSLQNAPKIAARIAAALRFFWSLRGHLDEGRISLEAALRTTENTISEVRFRLLAGLGVFLRNQGNYSASKKILEQMLAEGETANDLLQLVKANSGLAAVAVLGKDFAAAQKFNENALLQSRELKNEMHIAYCLCAFGDFELSRKNWSAARVLLEESLMISKKIANNRLLMNVYCNLGKVDYFENAFDSAASAFTESLRIAEGMGDKKIISCVLDGFAALSAQNGNYVQAAKIAGASEALRELIGFKIELAEEILREDFLDKTRAALSEKDFSEVYETGRTLDFSETISLTRVKILDLTGETNENVSETIIETHQISQIVIEEH